MASTLKGNWAILEWCNPSVFHFFPTADFKFSLCGGVGRGYDARTGEKEPILVWILGQTPPRSGSKCPHCSAVVDGPPYPKQYRPARKIRRLL